MTSIKTVLNLLLVSIVIQISEQHGRMIEPPARNSMWRVGFDTKPNYEDTELFCGGISVIIAQTSKLVFNTILFYAESMAG